MLGSVFGKTVRDLRRGFVWWSLGLIALAEMILAVYPTVRDNEELDQLVESYPEALKAFIAFGGQVDYTSGAGYLGSELFSFMVPLLLVVAAVGAGARAVAGEEERGTLELLLANPLSRRRIVADKALALFVEILALALVLWTALLAGGWIVGADVSAGHLGAACASAALLALAYGMLALLVGAATGHRAVAIGTSAAAAVAAYLLSSLAALVEVLDRIRWLSPFYHYTASDPLRHGLEAGHVAVLVGIGLGCLAGAALSFGRRDIGSA